MSKIKVYIGISGSGKTTLCREDLSKDPKGVRVNRDDLRYAVYGLTDETYGDYFKREDWYKCEQFITDLEERIINRAVSHGRNVYADNTHLKQKYIKKYYRYGVPVELEWVDGDLDLSIHRDFNRGRTVGNEVIEMQFNSYNILKREWKGYKAPEKKKIINSSKNPAAIVFDIDGTLAKMENRSPFDWKKVFEDKVNRPVARALWSYHKFGYKIIICTGRDGVCETDTKTWLSHHSIPFDEFHIRPEGDSRPDWQVKEEMWEDICERYYIQSLYDDRNQVVDHARSLGFTVFQVDYGDF